MVLMITVRVHINIAVGRAPGVVFLLVKRRSILLECVAFF